MNDANLKQWILDEAEGEGVEAVVIASDAYGDFPRYDEMPKGRLLTWDEAAPWLDFDFYSGHGGANCPPVYAWTATKVITIGEYDGATSCQSVPRHPIDCEPEYR